MRGKKKNHRRFFLLFNYYINNLPSFYRFFRHSQVFQPFFGSSCLQHFYSQTNLSAGRSAFIKVIQLNYTVGHPAFFQVIHPFFRSFSFLRSSNLSSSHTAFFKHSLTFRLFVQPFLRWSNIYLGHLAFHQVIQLKTLLNLRLQLKLYIFYKYI